MTACDDQTWTVSEPEADTRLDKWLAAADRLGSRSRALSALHRGKISIDEVEQTAAEAGRRLRAGEHVRLWMSRPGSAGRRYTERHTATLHLLYEDEELLVVNKPPGLLSVPLAAQPDAVSLLDLLDHHLRCDSVRRPLAVHRIDRDTSGVVLFAKSRVAQQLLKDQFERHEPERVYLSLVHGDVQPAEGEWRDHVVWDEAALKQRAASPNDPAAAEAICRFRVIERYARATVLEVALVTGKRNQIRLQSSLRGYPVVGETMYLADREPLSTIASPRQALHAWRLGFAHPTDGRPLRFEAPVPEDLQALLRSLRQGGKRPRRG
jgi:23S rRNA pseudouridine1911/1915/1917 synthase